MKRIICIILTIIIAVSIPITCFAYDDVQKGDSGDAVSQLQTWLRWYGYFNYRTTGRFNAITKTSVEKFQKQNQLDVTGVADDTTQSILYSSKAIAAEKNKNFVSVYGPRTVMPTEYGQVVSWNTIKEIFPISATAVIHDLYSDSVFTVVRIGGENNAEVTPASENDADEFVSMCGGASTWEKRPVKVEINGELYAGAIFCTLNKMDDSNYGTTQLYFSESTSDLFGIPDAEMNTAVMKAGGEIKL